MVVLKNMMKQRLIMLSEHAFNFIRYNVALRDQRTLFTPRVHAPRLGNLVSHRAIELFSRRRGFIARSKLKRIAFDRCARKIHFYSPFLLKRSSVAVHHVFAKVPMQLPGELENSRAPSFPRTGITRNEILSITRHNNGVAKNIRARNHPAWSSSRTIL